MANHCTFTMKVIGEPENIKELVDIMNYKKEDTVYLARIFQADVTDGDLVHDNVAFINGCCAWSVYSCMFEGPFSYYTQSKKSENGTSKLTTINQLSENLKLDIEIYSNEPGVGFEEHYVIEQGVIRINEEKEINSFNLEDYDNPDHFKDETGYDITQERFNDRDNNNWYEIGGYDWEFTI